MSRHIAMYCIAILSLSWSPASAQTTIDVSKITCRQYLLLKVADPDKLALWLSGYYHGKQGRTMIEVQRLKEKPELVKHFCLYKDKEATLMGAVESVFADKQ